MSRSRIDVTLLWALRVLAAIAGGIVLLIIVFLLMESAPALNNVGLLRFFSDESWHPKENLFNILPMICATAAVTLGAILIAAPLGILSAVFCHDFAPPAIARLFRKVIALLAGIPSVVFGFWALVVLIPTIAQWQPPGVSTLAAILVLALMIFPTVALLSDCALASVPDSYLQGAKALGLSRSTSLLHIVLPVAKTGIYTALLLATGRAMGETMAVLMVADNVVQFPANLFDPVRALTANIALEMAYAMGGHRAALFVSALILLLIVALLVIAAQRWDKTHAHN